MPAKAWSFVTTLTDSIVRDLRALPAETWTYWSSWFPHAAHMLHMEAAADVGRLVENFLRERVS